MNSRTKLVLVEAYRGGHNCWYVVGRMLQVSWVRGGKQPFFPPLYIFKLYKWSGISHHYHKLGGWCKIEVSTMIPISTCARHHIRDRPEREKLVNDRRVGGFHFSMRFGVGIWHHRFWRCLHLEIHFDVKSHLIHLYDIANQRPKEKQRRDTAHIADPGMGEGREEADVSRFSHGV